MKTENSKFTEKFDLKDKNFEKSFIFDSRLQNV